MPVTALSDWNLTCGYAGNRKRQFTNSCDEYRGIPGMNRPSVLVT